MNTEWYIDYLTDHQKSSFFEKLKVTKCSLTSYFLLKSRLLLMLTPIEEPRSIQNEPASTFSEISDTEFAIMSISSSLNLSISGLAIKGCTSKQILSIIHNHSDVQEIIANLRETKKYKFLSLRVMGINDDFIMETNKYVEFIDDHSKMGTFERYAIEIKLSAIAKFKFLVLNCDHKSIFRKDMDRLLDEFKNASSSSDQLSRVCDSEIDYLNEIGFLRPRREATACEDVYYFSHPHLGYLVSKLLEARNLILSTVGRRRYKEISMRELMKLCASPESGSEPKSKRQKVPISPFRTLTELGLKFHLFDMEGNGLLRRVKAPLGDIYRMPPIVE